MKITKKKTGNYSYMITVLLLRCVGIESGQREVERSTNWLLELNNKYSPYPVVWKVVAAEAMNNSGSKYLLSNC